MAKRTDQGSIANDESTRVERDELKRPDERGGEREIDQERISGRAYERYVERGREDGRDLDDWLEAKRELRERRGQ